MRGFLGGVSVGALVAVCGAAMWSLSTPLPPQVTVSTTQPQKVTPPSADGPAPIETPQGDADLVEAAPTAPQSALTADPSPASDADTQPSARPELSLPGGVAGSGEAVADPKPQAPAVPQTTLDAGKPAPRPEIAGGEASVEVSTAPLPAPVTQNTEPETQTAPAQEDTTVPMSAETASRTADTGGGGTASAPSETIPELGSAPAPSDPPLIAFAPPSAQSTEPDTGSQTTSEDEGPTAQSPQSQEAGEDRNRIADLPTTNGANRSDGSGIGTPVRPLTERDDRQAAPASAMETTPFDRYAVPYDASEGRPLMSIILIDDAQSVGAEALAEFPYPISFAIDPADPRAAEKMAAHRLAGFEVLILADLPREARPQDAETAMEVWLNRVPEVIGVLEGVKTGVQGNRPLADHVSDVARTGGYGLILQNSGLNTVQKMALRDGVPAGVVFRDFDGAGQNPRAMRRFLDQAAFRAGQEGAVIMLGRLRPETISALLLWGLQDRASRVELAPVSASLRANLAEASQ